MIAFVIASFFMLTAIYVHLCGRESDAKVWYCFAWLTSAIGSAYLISQGLT
jgi:hypothetical protein